MFQLLKQMLGVHTDPFSQDIKEAIELVVDESIHKVRLVNGYQRKLREPVHTALTYCAELAQQIPATLDLSHKDPVNVSIINGLFKSPEQARTVVAKSTEVKRFLDQNKVDELYVLMTMQRHTKTVFDSGIQGQIVVRDIATKAYLFEDHKLILPSETIEGAFHAIRTALLKVLSHMALEDTLDRQRREVELEQLRDELDVKLKLMREERQQMALHWDDPESKQLYVESQSLLHEVEQELAKVLSTTGRLESYLDRIMDILIEPGQHIRLDLLPMKLNRLGVFVRDESSDAEDVVHIAEFTFGESESRSVILLKCHRDQLKIDG